MFEGWAADLLATSLGRFVDVQKDKLRISLWSGERRWGRTAAGHGRLLVHQEGAGKEEEGRHDRSCSVGCGAGVLRQLVRAVSVRATF